MATFKAGDRVLIGKGNKAWRGWVESLNRQIGLTGTVEYQCADFIPTEVYSVRASNGTLWNYAVDSLTLITKEMNSKELYLHLQKETGLKIGDIVKVTGIARDYQFGWDTTWNALRMNETVGLTGKILAIRDTGVEVDMPGRAWTYPFYVLEKQEKPVYQSMQLTSDYKAKVYKDKIEVGCQIITAAKLKELNELFRQQSV